MSETGGRIEDVIHVGLVEPEIPPNTGNIARLCAANGLPLHLVGRLGFSLEDRDLRRAGLDYWPFVDLRRHEDLAALERALPRSRFFYFSARGARLYTEIAFRAGDCLVFGSESRGLAAELLAARRESTLRVPMATSCVRSLNLSTAAGIAVYEALRQLGFPGAAVREARPTSPAT